MYIPVRSDMAYAISNIGPIKVKEKKRSKKIKVK